MTPRLLDLYCGAGGAAVGYHRAGFDVVGVDIAPQPNYPYEFIQADVTMLRLFNPRLQYDAVHASPPCQAHSDLQKQSKRAYVDLVPVTRRILRGWGLPYVIENVEGAPLVDPIRLCGAMFPELRVYRHRLFESSIPLDEPQHPRHTHRVFTHDKRKAHYGKPLTDRSFVQVTGGGNAPVGAKLAAMGIDWMNGREVNQAIPPAYAEWVGAQLLAHLQVVAA